MTSQSDIVFTEIFPVNTNAVPPLSAYRLNTTSNLSAIGGKLAYRLNRAFDGHWVWADGLILTDTPQTGEKINQWVATQWSEQPETFKNLRGVSPIFGWTPSARAIADFVARGLFSDVEKNIQNVLSKNKQDLGNAVVERVCDLRGWVVNDAPAISVSISSNLVLKQDLKAYAARVPLDQLLGLQVADKTSSFKGELIKVVGKLATERSRLRSLTQRKEMQQLLISSPDDDWVVTVSNGRTDYDYTIGALRIILRLEYVHKFGIDSRKARSALQIEPKLRADIVKQVAEVLTDTTFVQRAFNSRDNDRFFRVIPYTTQVKFGDGSIARYDERTIIKELRAHKLYRVAERFKNGNPIRVGVFNALKRESPDVLWDLVKKEMRSLGFDVDQIGNATVTSGSRAKLEEVINEFEKRKPDILVAFFPNDFADVDDDKTAYYHFKSLTVGRGIPSQVIEASTLENAKSLPYSAQNVVLGILGKTGNVPYVLAEPLSFADVVVGIDIAREKKKRLHGSINTTATARIYLSNGDFLQYVIHDAPLEGETIPASVLQALFPKAKFQGKQVVIQRDGPFRGDEKSALYDWAAKIDATFLLMEVIKTGAPRIYAWNRGETIQPKKGYAFVMSASEAIVVSTPPPFQNATPRPLHIRADGAFPVEHALEAALAMTNLHYGAVRSPRLPVTIHYSDKMAYMALRGIKPKNLEGNIPFWL